MTPLDNDRFDDLVFARIVGGTATRPPPSAIVKSLQVVVPKEYDKPKLTAAVKASLARLTASKTVDKDRNILKVRELKGVGLIGARTWRQIRSRTVPALVLDLDDAVAIARLKDRGRWAAAILAHAMSYEGARPPTLAALGDDLAKKKRASYAQRIEAIAKRLDRKPNLAGGTYESQAADLAQQVLHAADASLDRLRAALVWRWLGAENVIRAEPPRAFEAEVRAVADRTSSGVPGNRKVFISAVWRDPAFKGIPLDEFKRRLVEAHKAGTVTLARADRIGGLDAAMLKESETPHLDSRYHFVERGGAS